MSLSTLYVWVFCAVWVVRIWQALAETFRSGKSR